MWPNGADGGQPPAWEQAMPGRSLGAHRVFLPQGLYPIPLLSIGIAHCKAASRGLTAVSGGAGWVGWISFSLLLFLLFNLMLL